MVVRAGGHPRVAVAIVAVVACLLAAAILTVAAIAGIDTHGRIPHPVPLPARRPRHRRQLTQCRVHSQPLSCQTMHELDRPRPDKTVFVCGRLGLGSTREQNAEALRAFTSTSSLACASSSTTRSLTPTPSTGDVASRPARRPAGDCAAPGSRRLGPDGDEYALEVTATRP